MAHVSYPSASPSLVEARLDRLEDMLRDVSRDLRALQRAAHTPCARASGAASAPIAAVVAEAERQHVLRVGAECRWNKTVMARVLGIDRKSLYARLRRLDLELPPHHRR